ncbi:hypothetical protein HYS00_03000 [Candidatus Microgenomates bacterium]|nr:hypothetical protein [Candidatus Microgenomates bacterium]
MNKYFYDHLIQIESLYVELDALKLSPSEKAELSALIESQIHHTVLDLILSNLGEEDKKLFLLHHANNNHDEVWSLLNKRIDTVENKIVTTVEDLKKMLHEDIREVRT